MSPQFELEYVCPVSPLLEYQVNCTTVDYAYSHTVLEKTQSDSDSTVLVDTDSENRFRICFQFPVPVLLIVFAENLKGICTLQ